MMPRQLKTAQAERRHQVANVQTVSRGIEPAVKRHRPGAQAFLEFRRVGAIGQQAAPLQFFVNVHQARKLSR
jgi:hypothetical protein